MVQKGYAEQELRTPTILTSRPYLARRRVRQKMKLRPRDSLLSRVNASLYLQVVFAIIYWYALGNWAPRKGDATVERWPLALAYAA